jgi:ADP-heptose:LPS heptosyltransferase
VNAVHQRNFLTSSTGGNLAFLLKLRQEGFDVSINTHPQSRIHYRGIARVVSARTRISHVYDCWTPLDRWLVNRTLPQDYGLHTVQQNLDVLPLLGGKAMGASHSLDIFLNPEDLDWAESFLTRHKLSDRKILGVHVGSGGTKNLRFKRWPLSAYAKLLNLALQRWPELSVLLFGGPDETRDIQWLIENVRSPHVLRAETKSLKQAGALIKRCRAFLSVDTALMHLTAAMKTPQVVIEAPTFNKTNEPFANTYFLARNPAVAGRNLDYYRYDGRGIKGSDSHLSQLMESVRVEAVLEALESVLT